MGPWQVVRSSMQQLNHSSQARRKTMKPNLTNLIPHLPRVLLTGAVVLAIASIAASDKAADKNNSAKAQPVSLAVNDRPISRDSKPVFSFAPVVKKVAPSVVCASKAY